MTFSLAANANNDLFLGTDGKLATVSGLAAVMQSCKTAMQAQRGEMMFAASNGMPTRAVAWDNYNPRVFEAAARGAVLSVDGVVGVLDFRVSRVGNQLAYSATIQTIYGTGVVSNFSASYNQAGDFLDYNFTLDHSMLG